MDKQIPWTKLGKYISGNGTPPERKYIENWIEAEPGRQEFVEELKEVWQKSSQQEDWDVDSAWNMISGKLDNDRTIPLRLVQSSAEREKGMEYIPSVSRKRSFGIRMVASLAIIFGVLLTVLFFINNYETATPEAPLPMQEVVAEKGQRSRFKLNDGTQVWLNADSRLKISPQFNAEQREVYLEGEAFFKVARDPEKPFLVHAGKSLTKVLGTRFNVQAYLDEGEVQVVVEEGRVAFGRRSENIDDAPELTRNQMGILSDKRQTLIQELNNLDLYTGWTQGRLVFKDTPLSKAIKRLERWYDIECTIAEPALEDRTVTASFKDESMTEVLKIIALSVGMTYEKDKRLIKFLSKQKKSNQVFEQ